MVGFVSYHMVQLWRHRECTISIQLCQACEDSSGCVSSSDITTHPYNFPIQSLAIITGGGGGGALSGLTTREHGFVISCAPITSNTTFTPHYITMVLIRTRTYTHNTGTRWFCRLQCGRWAWPAPAAQPWGLHHHHGEPGRTRRWDPQVSQ